MDEHRIISLCLSGDKGAYELIVKKYQAPLLGMAYGLLGNRDEAKDAVQDAFIQAFVNLKRFDTARSFKTWIFSITYKRCVDRIRMRKTFDRMVQKMSVEEGLEACSNCHEVKFDESQACDSVLARLSDKERTVVILKVNEGYSAREIAEVLDCGESTVRVTFFNAKKKIRKFIREKDRCVNSIKFCTG